MIDYYGITKELKAKSLKMFEPRQLDSSGKTVNSVDYFVI
jgi:hypothetical protein